MYEIEQNVPMPASVNGKPPGLVAALRAMKVGDSCLIPKERRNSAHATFRLVPDTKFATRTVSATEVRIWRTA